MITDLIVAAVVLLVASFVCATVAGWRREMAARRRLRRQGRIARATKLRKPGGR